MKKYKKFFLIILMISCTSVSFASTLRHIYNYSDQTWFVQFAGKGFNIHSEKNTAGTWIIKAHTNYQMNYNDDANNDDVQGHLLICDSAINQRCYAGRLDIYGAHINHDGNTGPAFDVNRPASGDIRIWKDYLL